MQSVRERMANIGDNYSSDDAVVIESLNERQKRELRDDGASENKTLTNGEWQ